MIFHVSSFLNRLVTEGWQVASSLGIIISQLLCTRMEIVVH